MVINEEDMSTVGGIMAAKANKYDALVDLYRRYVVYQNGLLNLLDEADRIEEESLLPGPDNAVPTVGKMSKKSKEAYFNEMNESKKAGLREECVKIGDIIEILEKNLFNEVLTKEIVLKLSPHIEMPKD